MPMLSRMRRIVPIIWLGLVIPAANAQQLERRLLPTDQKDTRLMGVNVGTFQAGQTIQLRIEAENLQLGVRKFFQTKSRGPWGIFGSSQVHRTIGNPVGLWEAFPLISLKVQKPHDDINATLDLHPDGDPVVSVTASQDFSPRPAEAGDPGLSRHPGQVAPESYALPTEIADLLRGKADVAGLWRATSAVTVRIEIAKPPAQGTPALRDQRWSLAVAMPNRYFRGGEGSQPQGFGYAPVSCDQVGDVGYCSTGAFRISLVSVNSDARQSYVHERLRGEYVPANEIISSLLDWWLTRRMQCQPAGAARPNCTVVTDAEASQKLAEALQIQLVQFALDHNQDKDAKLRLLKAANQLDPGNTVLSGLLVAQLVGAGDLQSALKTATEALKYARTKFNETLTKTGENGANLVPDWINLARASRNFADVVMRMRVGTLGADVVRATQVLADAERDFDHLRKANVVTGEEDVLGHYASLISDQGRALLRTRTQEDMAAARRLLGYAFASAPTIFDSTAVATSAGGTVLTFVEPRRFFTSDRRAGVEQRRLVAQAEEQLLGGLATPDMPTLGKDQISRSGGTPALFVSPVEIIRSPEPTVPASGPAPAAGNNPPPGPVAGLKFRSVADSPDGAWSCEVPADIPADRIAFAHRLSGGNAPAQNVSWLVGFRGATAAQANGVRLLTAPSTQGGHCTLADIPIAEVQNPRPGASPPETIMNIDWADRTGRHRLDEAPLAFVTNGAAWSLAWTDRASRQTRIATLSSGTGGRIAAWRKGRLASELVWLPPKAPPNQAAPPAPRPPLTLESDDPRWFDTVPALCSLQRESGDVEPIDCNDPAAKDQVIDRVLSFSTLDDPLREMAGMNSASSSQALRLREGEALLALSELVAPQGSGTPYFRLTLVGRKAIDDPRSEKGPTVRPPADCNQAALPLAGNPPADKWSAQCNALSITNPVVAVRAALSGAGAETRVGRPFHAPPFEAGGNRREIYVPLSMDGRSGPDLVAFLLTPPKMEPKSKVPIADAWKACQIAGPPAIARCFFAPEPVASAGRPDSPPAGPSSSQNPSSAPKATTFAPAAIVKRDPGWMVFSRLRSDMGGETAEIIALQRPQGNPASEVTVLGAPDIVLGGFNRRRTEMDRAAGPAHVLGLARVGGKQPDVVLALPRASLGVEIFSRRINRLPVADRLNVEFDGEDQAVAAVDQGSLLVIRHSGQRLEVARRPAGRTASSPATEIFAPLFVDVLPLQEATQRPLNARPVAACDDGTPHMLPAAQPAGLPAQRPCGDETAQAAARPVLVAFNSQSERTTSELWYTAEGDSKAFAAHRAEVEGGEVRLLGWPRSGASCRIPGLDGADIVHAVLSPRRRLADSCDQLHALVARRLGDDKWRWMRVPANSPSEGPAAIALGEEQPGQPPSLLDETGQRQTRVTWGDNGLLVVEWVERGDQRRLRRAVCTYEDGSSCRQRQEEDVLSGWLGGRRIKLSTLESAPRSVVFDSSTQARKAWLASATGDVEGSDPQRCVASSQMVEIPFGGIEASERMPIPVLMGDRPLGVWRKHGVSIATETARPATYVWVAVSSSDGGAAEETFSCSPRLVGVLDRARSGQ
jgi:hypothetical protein